jgi:anti-sigma B factor antagonist
VSHESVSFTRRGTASVVTLVGEIDLANAPVIGREIVSLVPGDGAVLFDLTAVSFLDSAGVRLLDALVGDLDDGHRPVRLVVGETGAARMTLQLCAFRDDLLATDLDKAAHEVNE